MRQTPPGLEVRFSENSRIGDGSAISRTPDSVGRYAISSQRAVHRYWPEIHAAKEEVQYEAQVDHLRHVKFAGPREGKEANDVRRE